MLAEHPCLVHVGAGRKRSNSMRGRINPKVMAMMIRNAVAPFAAMVVSRLAGAAGPIETNSMTHLAAWNRKKSGIIETTAEIASRQR
jgi:hypothetical protein